MPEQMFVTDEAPGEAISAVRALEKASAAGQRIYHVTPANQAQVLPDIHHNTKVMAEIRSALASGREVVTHTNAVSVPGWSGAGYILFDPETGDGAYKIGGGLNGAFTAWLVFMGMMLITAILLAPAIAFVSSIVFIFFGIKAVAVVLSLWAALALSDAAKRADPDLSPLLRAWSSFYVSSAAALSKLVKYIVMLTEAIDLSTGSDSN